MTWDSLLFFGVVITSMTIGMILGAWFAARGFEKSLVKTMEDPEAPWNKKE
jgi:uncharacterized protein YneF (UPF0154 family)